MLPAQYAVSSSGGNNVIDLTTVHSSSSSARTSMLAQQQQQQRNVNATVVQSLLADVTKSIQTITSGGGASKEREKSETMYRLKTAEDSFVKFMDLVDRTTEPNAKAIYKKRLAMAQRRLEQNEDAYEQLEKKSRPEVEQEHQPGVEEDSSFSE